MKRKAISKIISKLFFFLIVNDITTVSAQNFERSFGGQLDDLPEMILPAFDGGYILAGTKFDTLGSNNIADILIIKTDTAGSIQWSETISTNGDDQGFWIERTPDSSYVITGNTYDYLINKLDIFFIRIDLSGTILSQKIYNVLNSERANCIRSTSDGGFIIAGETVSSNADLEMYMLKIDSTGNVMWSKAFGDSENESAQFISQTSDGGYVLAGTSRFGLSWSSIFIVKTDSIGNLNWSMKYNTQPFLSRCKISRIIQTQDGGYLLSGTSSDNQPLESIVLIKTDSSGNIEWQRQYGSGGGERNNDIFDDETGYVMCGSTATQTGNDEIIFMKTDYNGNLRWQLGFGIPDSNLIANSMIQSLQRKIILLAYSDASQTGYPDFFLITCDTILDNNLCYMKTQAILQDTLDLVATPFIDSATVITIQANGNFQIGPGVTENFNCNVQTSVEEIKKPEASVYPNPFSRSTTITISTDAPCNLKMDVYDLNGRIVNHSTETSANEIDHRFEIDNSSNQMKPGIYHCRFYNSDYNFSMKLVLIN